MYISPCLLAIIMYHGNVTPTKVRSPPTHGSSSLRWLTRIECQTVSCVRHDSAIAVDISARRTTSPLSWSGMQIRSKAYLSTSLSSLVHSKKQVQTSTCKTVSKVRQLIGDNRWQTACDSHSTGKTTPTGPFARQARPINRAHV